MKLHGIASIALLMFAAACGGQAGGETHWVVPPTIATCQTDVECNPTGGDYWGCSCGICVKACESDAACGDLENPSICVDRSDERLDCNAPAVPFPTEGGVCKPTCEDDRECSEMNGEGWTCDGICVPPPAEQGLSGFWSQTAGPVGSDSTLGLYTHGATDLFLAGWNGLLHSSDGGHNWSKGPVLPGPVTHLVSGSDALYALVSGGSLFRSTDGGATWARTGESIRGTTVSLDARGDRLYAVAVENDVADLGASSDGGATWEPLAALPEGGQPGAIFALGDLLLAADRSTGKAFVSADDGATWTAGSGSADVGLSVAFAAQGGSLFAIDRFQSEIFRSVDGGATWTSVAIPGSGASTGAGWFAHLGEELFVATGGGLVYRWDAASEGWLEARTGLEEGRIAGFHGGPAGLFASIDQQLYRWDGGAWGAVKFGLVGTDVDNLASDGTRLFASSGADAIHVSTDGGESWQRSTTGLPGWTEVSALAASGEMVIAGTREDGPFVSFDGGATWSPANRGFPQYEATDGQKFRAITALSIGDDFIFAATGGSGLVRSRDDGLSWEPAREGLPILGNALFGDVIYDEVPAIARTGEILYVGTENHGIFRSDDDGSTWTAVNDGLPVQENGAFGSVRGFAVLDDQIFAVTSGKDRAGGIFHTATGGRIWSRLVTDDIPGDPTRIAMLGRTLIALFDDPDATVPGEGVYSKFDGQDTFMPVGTDLGAEAGTLGILGGQLFVGTHGAGVWKFQPQP